HAEQLEHGQRGCERPVRIDVAAPERRSAQDRGLDQRVWDRELVALTDAALVSAAEARLDLGKTPALLIGWNVVGAWEVHDFLAIPASDAVRMRFVSPTRFGFGRHPNGSARAHVVPDPGPVVASWLRAWQLTGDRNL